MQSRRSAAVGLVVAIALAAGCAGAGDEPSTVDAPPSAEGFSEAIAGLEREHDARVGVMFIDVESGERLAHREDERFGFASTMKAYAAAALLDATDERDREAVLRWSVEDAEAAGYSPVTEKAVDDGLSLGELAEAAVRDSDNLAMNLVLEEIGGPEGLGSALAAVGDSVTRPVDVEPDLNDVVPGEEANTSTAAGLAGTLERLMSGDWLDDRDRDVLLDWMGGNATGDTLIRAGAPEGWEVMDKSGGAGAIRNDVAIVSPPGRGPVVLVVLTERNDGQDYDDALVADVARVALDRAR